MNSSLNSPCSLQSAERIFKRHQKLVDVGLWCLGETGTSPIWVLWGKTLPRTLMISATSYLKRECVAIRGYSTCDIAYLEVGTSCVSLKIGAELTTRNTNRPGLLRGISCRFIQGCILLPCIFRI